VSGWSGQSEFDDGGWGTGAGACAWCWHLLGCIMTHLVGMELMCVNSADLWWYSVLMESKTIKSRIWPGNLALVTPGGMRSGWHRVVQVMSIMVKGLC
jgi:hypothetical protein